MKGFDESNPFVFQGLSVRKCVVILFGPTAVGKTELGERLAAALPGEIVNGDMGQFYTPLTIGTAKPDWIRSATPQHLFDIINEPRMMSVTEYRDRVMCVLNQIWARKNIPIIIGGSGFYIKSLFFPPTIGTSSKSNGHVYAPEEKRWQQLYEIDPERARRIHPHDFYRINRALDIFFTTGQKPSEHMPRYQPIGSFCFVYLQRDRSDLYNRINERALLMLRNGWLQEVARLQNTQWESFLKSKKLIGYDDILEYLEKEKKEDQLILAQHIAQKTRNYAKRQETFGNKLYQQLEKATVETADLRSSCVRFNLTSGNVELYINQLLKMLGSMHCI